VDVIDATRPDLAGLICNVWVLGVVVVQEEKLSEVLSDFARTLTTDFRIQAILDHLVDRIVEVLPITAAGVTLISAGKAPHYVAASNASALRFERLQTEIAQGPCMLAFESGEAVSIPDLIADDRFPDFGPPAVAAGLVAVFTFPLRHGGGRLGALDLYRDTSGSLDAEDMGAAQTLADVATAYLLNAQAREDARTASDHFRHGALHDPLTGLPNRLLLKERLVHATRRARRSHTNAAILFIDLDHFKRVNDTHGHQMGDTLLISVAQRLSALVRPGDTFARFSGDEFVVLCEDLREPADVEILARRIDGAFTKPFTLGSLELDVTASVGVAFAGPGEDISKSLLAKADMAMYQAKRDGGARHQTIDLREADATYDRNSLEVDLRWALGRNKLDIAYQPIVRSSDRKVTGVEALLRWSHPQRGAVSPTAIVELAEQSELINMIGTWVLERSCSARAEWLHRHPEAPMDLAVNVSARQLMSQDLYATVASVLDRTRMDPHALILEVTENVFIEDTARTMSVLTSIKELGIRLALDDFGTGYSSLSYLRRLPIDVVKIDSSFIADIGHPANGGAIVAAVTNLAHVLGLAVVAEGVETQFQRDEVSAMGCEFAQGFFYAAPMPASAIGAHLDRFGQSLPSPA
jgi:diguanylate cyclase (GGDEF)-like protein